MSNALEVNIRLNEDDIEDFTSLEYEEDCFYALVSKSETPSFDIEESDWDEENGSMFVLVDEEEFDPPPLDLPEQCTVETEFYSKKLGKNKFIKAVRVKFQDLSKPYLAKITSQKNYTKFLQLVNGEKPHGDMSPDSGINELAGLSPEEQERQKKEWADELAKVEEEIQTLRHVLASKVKVSHELKRKLGFSVWREFQDDMSQGIKNVKESNVYQVVEEKVGQIGKAVSEAPIYQKTESVIKATTEKTSSILGGLGSGISSKIGQLKNSESFRSFEERVGSAYENTKVSTSRSSSMQSFDDALRDVERDMDRKLKSPVTTPTINEERPS
ncbi:tumor protein D54 isoform X2 [Halyomorpha halys]|uniref:tumor protein D54 isoform X2 n=1 Tax=Halyomorpha halys TaxID=286706 RepID=UPI0006D52908|nr:tumor protein D54 isoform X2 [Halyomorpha halys]